jgi:serine/threonine protein phosphatase PrpC
VTDSGHARHINEDTLYLAGKIRPEEMRGHEIAKGRSSERQQMFLVADGFGGPGIGDLAGRIVTQVARMAEQRLAEDPRLDIDFPTFARELLTEADRRIQHELLNRTHEEAGCSLALLLMRDEYAYSLGVGNAIVYLVRNGEPYIQIAPQSDANNEPALHLGQRADDSVPVLRNVRKVKMAPGDVFAIATDGLYEQVTPAEVAAILSDARSFTARVTELYNTAATRSDEDDRTLLAVQVVSLDHDVPSVAALPEHSAYRRPDGDEDAVPKERFYTPEDYSGGNFTDDKADAAYREQQEIGRMRRHVYRDPNRRPGEKREKRKPAAKRDSLLTVFLKSLLIGFLVGAALLMIVWFFLLS